MSSIPNPNTPTIILKTRFRAYFLHQQFRQHSKTTLISFSMYWSDAFIFSNLICKKLSTGLSHVLEYYCDLRLQRALSQRTSLFSTKCHHSKIIRPTVILMCLIIMTLCLTEKVCLFIIKKTVYMEACEAIISRNHSKLPFVKIIIASPIKIFSKAGKIKNKKPWWSQSISECSLKIRSTLALRLCSPCFKTDTQLLCMR